MKRIYYLGSYLSLFLVLLYSCGEKKVAQSGPVEVPVVKVIQKDVPIYREFVGQVYGEKDIPIRARVEGVLEGIHFNEGQSVTKGQLLYSIDPQPLEARVNSQKSILAQAKTGLAKAESDLNRYKPLAAENAVSQSDLVSAQADYDAAVSEVAAAKSNLRSAQIELGYTKIYSPIDGLIGVTKARVGDFVGRDPNPIILNTVSETNNVRVQFFLTESEYLTVSREFTAARNEAKADGVNRMEVKEKNNLQLILSDGTLYKEKGSVDFIDRGVDATTGTMLVQGTFPNPNMLLRPGLYGKVKIMMLEVKDALLVPQRCVTELQGKLSVYVVTNENKVESRQIKARHRIGDYYLVSEGVKLNESIVIDALQKVQTGMIVVPTVTEFASQVVIN